MLTEVPVCELGTHSLKKSQELLTLDCLLLRTSAHYISRVFLKAKIPSQRLNRNCDRRNGTLTHFIKCSIKFGLLNGGPVETKVHTKHMLISI